eukprot:4931089-Amphidinium_carterae.2
MVVIVVVQNRRVGWDAFFRGCKAADRRPVQGAEDRDAALLGHSRLDKQRGAVQSKLRLQSRQK